LLAVVVFLTRLGEMADSDGLYRSLMGQMTHCDMFDSPVWKLLSLISSFCLVHLTDTYLKEYDFVILSYGNQKRSSE
jgi:hypothetical protein